MRNKIYLDYAASTPMKKEVLDSMMPFFTEIYGNASSVHSFGRELQQKTEKCRRKIAKFLLANKDEIYFTSGGTESDNWAIKGIAASYKEKGKHIITSKTEHHAVLNACRDLENDGFEVTYLDVDEEGYINKEVLLDALRDDTILVSIMHINNEIGTIQNIKELSKLCKNKGVLFHSDAVQSLGQVPIDLSELDVDLMSFSGHKIYGPTGIGVLYIRKGVKIKSLLSGGAQERSRRAGTINVSGVVGFTKAMELSLNNLDSHIDNLTKLRNRLIAGLNSKLTNIKLNGPIDNRHPGNVNISFVDVKGETLLMNMDLAGIGCSSGSACSSGSLDPSHVLLAIGLEKKSADASLRMSIGDFTTEEEIDYVIEKLSEIILRIRSLNN